MAVAGVGLLSAQRLVGGTSPEGVLDHEVILDLNTPQILSIEVRRSDACLSGHRRFEPTQLDQTAAETTVGELFVAARRAVGSHRVSLEAWGHPILLALACPSGHQLIVPGTPWRPLPPCAECGLPMLHRNDVALKRFNEAQAKQLDISDTTCEELGLPRSGALLLAQAPDRPSVQLLLARRDIP
jgi:hypothetical protein